jgi:hypothetical protein
MRNFQFPFDYGLINTDSNWTELGLCLDWTCQGPGSLSGWFWHAHPALLLSSATGLRTLWGDCHRPHMHPSCGHWPLLACLSSRSSSPTWLWVIDMAAARFNQLHLGLAILLFLPTHSFSTWHYWAAAVCWNVGLEVPGKPTNAENEVPLLPSKKPCSKAVSHPLKD